MQISKTGGNTLYFILITAFTSAYGHMLGCLLNEVPGFKGLYSQNGIKQSCPPGTIFDLLKCTCVHGAVKSKVCLYKEVPTDITTYREIATGRVLPCKKGMAFNILICRCEPNPKAAKACKRFFALDFNQSTLKNKLIHYNVGGGQTLGIRRGFGEFRKNSEILFWTTKNRPFEEHLQVQMNFTDDPTSKAKREVLVTNCDAEDNPNVPSLLIYLDKTKENPAKQDLVRVQMRTYNMSQGVEVTVPFRSGEPNTLVVLKALDTLKVRIIYQDLTDAISANRLVGEIITSHSVMRLGACPKDFNGFVGLLNWFDYFPCWPRY